MTGKKRFPVSGRGRGNFPRPGTRPDPAGLASTHPPGRHLFPPEDAQIRITLPIGSAGFGLVDLDAALAEIDGPPRVLIRSDGGSIDSGLALAERINATGATVYAYAAQSAAILPVIAGHHRIVAQNGWLATHPAWSAIAGGRLEFEAAAKRCARIDALLAESIARWSKLTPEEAAQAIATGTVWDARAALAAGLVDEIGPAVDGIGTRPDRVVDGSAREFHTLLSAADAARLRAEHERATTEATNASTAAPAIARITGGHINAHYVEAFTPPDRLSGLLNAAAGHARRQANRPDPEPWTPRWCCEHCGATNFHPPAAGFKPTGCTSCNSNEDQ